MENNAIYTLLAVIAGFLPGIVFAAIAWRKFKKGSREFCKQIEAASNRASVCSQKLEVTNTELGFMKASHNLKVKEMENEIQRIVMENEFLKLRNQELDQLLKEGQPVIHSLKMKLIEANNTIVRYKAQLRLKDT